MEQTCLSSITEIHLPSIQPHNPHVHVLHHTHPDPPISLLSRYISCIRIWNAVPDTQINIFDRLESTLDMSGLVKSCDRGERCFLLTQIWRNETTGQQIRYAYYHSTIPLRHRKQWHLSRWCRCTHIQNLLPPTCPLIMTLPMCLCLWYYPKNRMTVKHANVQKSNPSHRRADAGSTGQPSKFPAAPRWTWRRWSIVSAQTYAPEPEAIFGVLVRGGLSARWRFLLSGGFAQVGVCRRHSWTCSVSPRNLRDLHDPRSSRIVQLELEGRYSARQIRALVPLFVDQSHPSINHDGVTSVKTEIQQKSSFVGIWAF